MSNLQSEAAVYWKTAQRFRLKLQFKLPTDEERDDLEAINMHTENAVMRRDSRRLLYPASDTDREVTAS